MSEQFVLKQQTKIQKYKIETNTFKLFPVLFSIVVALLLLCSELDDGRKTKRNQSE
jgi:uncharacterized membrane protein affecting hemolysin expression